MTTFRSVISNSARNLLVAITLLFATSLSAFAQLTPVTFISTAGALSSTSTDGESRSYVCSSSNYPDGIALTIEGNVDDMNMAFSGCASLKEVTINGNVTDMSGAFWYCYDLSSITFTQTTPPNMVNAFIYDACRDVDKVVVYIPYSSYKNPTIKQQWQTAITNAGLSAGKLKLQPDPKTAPPRKQSKISKLNIKQGKVEIKPRE